MLVLCVGMRRAASTSQYLIAREIVCTIQGGKDFGYEDRETSIRKLFLSHPGEAHAVVKTHDYYNFYENGSQSDVKFLGTYRDMRDVALSFMKANNCTLGKLVRTGFLEKEIETYYKFARLRSSFMQDYRDLVGDFRKAIVDVADFLGARLSDADIQCIHEKHNMDSLKKKAEEYSRTLRSRTIDLINRVFIRLNPTSKMATGLITNRNVKDDLHRNHFAAVPTDWRSQLTEKEKEALKAITADWLIDVGLETDRLW